MVDADTIPYHDCCRQADVDSGVPRAHQRVFAASLMVFDVVSFMPDFSSGGDNRDTILPVATLGFRRTVLDAAVAPSCAYHSASRGFLFLDSLCFIARALAATSSAVSVCIHQSFS